MDDQRSTLGVVPRGQLELGMAEGAHGVFELKFVEIHTGVASVKIEFDDETELDHVVQASVAPVLNDLVEQSIRVAATTSFYKTDISLPGILLSECIVRKQHRADGGHDIVVHFNKVFGSVQNLFSRNLLSINAAVPDANEIMIDTLETALIPLFDLGAYIREQITDASTISQSQMSEAIAGLAARIEALEVSFETIRQVNRTMPIATPLPANEDTLLQAI